MDWTQAQAPSLDDIEKIAAAAFASLPEKFRALCESIPFLVQEFPDDDVIADLELESEFDILGLFQGPDLAAREAGEPSEPTLIFLYRRPILDYWAEHREALGTILRHVIIHEIGHHFGLSDAAMEQIEANSE
jgi:predicted Zn-dependent protease with MMP-like domain